MVINISNSPMFDRLAALVAESREQEIASFRRHMAKLREAKDEMSNTAKTEDSTPANQNKGAIEGDRGANEIVKRRIELLKIYIDDLPDYMDISSNSNSQEAKEFSNTLEVMTAEAIKLTEFLLAMHSDLNGLSESPKINLISGGGIDVSEKTDLFELCIVDKQ